MHTGLANLGLSASPNGLSPVLDLQFLSNAGVDGRITYSGGAGGTYTDSTGVIRRQRGNLVLLSNDFGNTGASGWTPTAGGTASLPVLTPNIAIAPDGTLTASKLLLDKGAGTTTNDWAQFPTSSPITGFNTGENYTFSIYAKASRPQDVGAVVGFRGAGAASYGTMTLTNAWQLVQRAEVAAGASLSVSLALRGGGTIAGGSDSAEMLIWEAQVEPGLTATPRIHTAGAAVFAPRIDFDPVTHAPKGVLVEEQRTNLASQSASPGDGSWSLSNETITLNAATAPDGSVSMTQAVETAVVSAHGYNRAYVASAGTYTFSIFLKPIGTSKYTIVRMNDATSNANAVSVVVDITNGAITTAATAFGTFTTPSASAPVYVGNGIYRCSVTANCVGVTSIVIKVLSSADGLLAADGQGNTYLGVVTNGFYGWGAQLEAGSFATSYIPTAAAAVTRTVDSLTMSGANFSSWFNTLQGAFVAEFDTVALSNPSVRGVVTSGVSARYAYIPGTASTIASYDGTLVINSVASVVDGLPHKVASSYASTRTLTLDGAAVVNGAQAAAYTQGSTLLIGDINGSAVLNGHIKRLRYWPRQLANTQLQKLTA